MPTHRSLLPLCILSALSVLFAAPAAFAEESPSPFGARGQVTLDDLVGLSAGSSRFAFATPLLPPLKGDWSDQDWSDAGYNYHGIFGYVHDTRAPMSEAPNKLVGSTNTVWFSPSVDVFVHDRLSIGATLSAAYAAGSLPMVTEDGRVWQMEGRGYGLTFVPRIGYAIPLGDSFMLWPRVGFGYSVTSAEHWSVIPSPLYWASASSIWLAEGELGIVARVHRYIYLRGAPSLRIASGVSGATFTGGTESFSVRFGVTAGVGILLGS